MIIIKAFFGGLFLWAIIGFLGAWLFWWRDLKTLSGQKLGFRIYVSFFGVLMFSVSLILYLGTFDQNVLYRKVFSFLYPYVAYDFAAFVRVNFVLCFAAIVAGLLSIRGAGKCSPVFIGFVVSSSAALLCLWAITQIIV